MNINLDKNFIFNKFPIKIYDICIYLMNRLTNEMQYNSLEAFQLLIKTNLYTNLITSNNTDTDYIVLWNILKGEINQNRDIITKEVKS